MDLGIAGRTVLVCASSKGLGRACAWELARAGCTLIINGRDEGALDREAEAIARETGVAVRIVVADQNSEEGLGALLACCGSIDILVNNNGGPPARAFRDVDAGWLEAGVHSNMIVPIRLVQAVLDGMVERRFGRIVCITSVAVKQVLPGLEVSSAARTGLTGFLAGVARGVAHANVTINSLLPGAFATARSQSMLEATAKAQGIAPEELQRQALAANPSRRMGRPEEFGAACAFLCSAQAGYITGQNLVIDGGAFPAVI